MLKGKFVLAGAVALCLGFFSSSYALFGLGIHYSFDYSVKMPDGLNDKLTFDSLKLATTPGTGFTGGQVGTLPATPFGPQDIPIYFDRSGFERTPFFLGGKVYVDCIPFIDCIEIGGDFGTWQYMGRIRYPSDISVNQSVAGDTSLLQMIKGNLASVTYDTMDLTLKGNGINFPGITETPYVKLDLDVTIRKYIKIMLIDKFIKPYGGAGFDVHFATPVPSSGLIKDALGDVLNGTKTIADLQNILNNTSNQKKITQEILNQLMTPHYGVNIVVGTIIKPPVVPIGVYVDARYLIPFEPFDKNANVTGMGFKINTGLCLHFGK